jgi:hypothetical protein
MRLWRKIRQRWGEDGLAQEMRSHREMIADRLRAEGLSPAEARTRTAREFGPLATAIEDRRQEWTWAWVEALWSDAKYACRALARDKTFAATAVLTLGAGLALASVAFTLFNAYVLRPFAVADPDSLYAVRYMGKDTFASVHPWLDFEQLRAKKEIFADAYASRGVFVGGINRHWTGTLVSDNYFRMLGARARIGRFLEPGDGNVVVLSAPPANFLTVLRTVAGSTKRETDGLRSAHHLRAGSLPCSTKAPAIFTARENVPA